jgi:TPP-dependent indolepyruvate ferredoxin oxidoreductase alpha subunit
MTHAPVTIVISDNESVSMTGGQDSSAEGKKKIFARELELIGAFRVIVP